MDVELLTLNVGVMERAKRIERVGSRVTCEPPIMTTDIDLLVLCDSFEDVGAFLAGNGFELGGSHPVDPNYADSAFRFESYSNGEYNYIITRSEDFFNRFMAATSVAKRLNLRMKSDRIALFQAVLYGNPCT
jgi:hypothetical protein